MIRLRRYRPRYGGDAVYYQTLDAHFDAIATQYDLDDRWLNMDDQAQLDLLFGVGERRPLITMPAILRHLSECPFCPSVSACELSRDDAALIVRLTEAMSCRSLPRFRLQQLLRVPYAHLDVLLDIALEHNLIKRQGVRFRAITKRLGRPRYVRFRDAVRSTKAGSV